MHRTLLAVLCFSVLASVPLAAQAVTLVVDNARVVVGNGTVLEEASIGIAHDRIVSVTTERVDAPDAIRIDAAGKTALPGLIDTHVHLTMEKLFEQPRTEADLRAFMDDGLSERLSGFLDAGVTTVMSTGDYWPYIAEVRERVRAGDLVGPRILTAGPIVTAPNGHPAGSFCGFLDLGGPNPWCRAHLAVEVGTPDEARTAVVALAEEGVDAVKFVHEAWGPPQLGVLDPDVATAVVAAAHELDLRVYAHIVEHDLAIASVEAGLDGLVHLPGVPSGQQGVRALVGRMLERGVTTSTTLTVFHDFAKMTADQGQEEKSRAMSALLAGMQVTLARLAEANDALIAVGTDAPHRAPGAAYHQELALLVESGLEADQVIRAATKNAAVHIGMADELGTLEPGKLADVLVVDGDPLADLSALENVAHVILAGQEVRRAVESDSLEAFVREYEETWQSHDAERLAGFFTEDSDMIVGILPRISGRAAIETWWGLYFSRIDRGRALSISIDSIRRLSPDIALLNVQTTTGGTHSETSEELESRRARGTWVVTRVGGEWKIAALRAHSPVGQQRPVPGTDD